MKEQDLENTTYRFELEDGEVVEVKGNEEIEYDGEMHTAANLFDAMKEVTRKVFDPIALEGNPFAHAAASPHRAQSSLL